MNGQINSELGHKLPVTRNKPGDVIYPYPNYQPTIDANASGDVQRVYPLTPLNGDASPLRG